MGRNLHWLVDPDAQRVRRMVQFSPGVVDAALRTTDSPTAAFRFLLADDINLSDEDLDELLRSLGHKKTVGAPPADTPSTADPAQKARGWLEAFGQGIILNVFYGVKLTADSECDPDKYTDWRAWMRDPKCVTEAYKAVTSTAAALKRANDAAHRQGGDPKLAVASYMPGGIPEFLLFRQVMGPIRMNLSNVQRDYSAEVSPNAKDGMVVNFFRLNGRTDFIPGRAYDNDWKPVPTDRR